MSCNVMLLRPLFNNYL